MSGSAKGGGSPQSANVLPAVRRADRRQRQDAVVHPEARDHVPGVQPAHAVGDEVDAFVREPLGDDTRRSSAARWATPAVWLRLGTSDAMPGRDQRVFDPGEVAQQRERADLHAVEAEQAVDQYNRGAGSRGSPSVALSWRERFVNSP